MFTQLFKLTVMHDYFADGKWKDLSFLPGSEIARMVSQGDIYLLTRPGEIQAFFDTGRMDILRRHTDSDSGTLKFNFKVKVGSRDFREYTDWPEIQNDTSLLFFSNEIPDSAELTRKGRVSQDDVFDVDELLANGDLEITGLELSPDFLVSISLPFNSRNAPRKYALHFNARSAYWKYYLMNSRQNSEYSIVDTDNRVEFEYRGNAALTEDRFGKVFMSRQRIPFMESSSYRFQLREQGIGNGKVLIKRLPVASGTRLGYEEIAGKREIVSENFINF